jgi:hypothetical protein
VQLVCAASTPVPRSNPLGVVADGVSYVRQRPDTGVLSVLLCTGEERPQFRAQAFPTEATPMRQVFNSPLALSAYASLSLTLFAMPEYALAQISVSIALAPPALPVYEQPVLVEQGGLWAPGYWAYDQDDGYFWVPGAWVQPPEAGLLWTPGYWGWRSGGYAWNDGYWGPTVGFYGGIAYGFGYPGRGYTGGHWQGQQFYYNTAVSHVNVTNIHNTYTQTITNNTTVTRVSYNGGTGGVAARPTAAEQAATRAPHQPATGAQLQYRQAALASPALSASVNHGKPAVAATSKPAEPTSVAGTAAASPEAAAKAAAATPAEKRAPAHAADLPAIAHPVTASTGDSQRDKVNQQQQDDLRNSQVKQRQELQQKQAADHAQAARQPSTSASVQELERQHQAQTQALAQRHTTEQQTLQAAQAKKPEAKPEAARHT